MFRVCRIAAEIRGLTSTLLRCEVTPIKLETPRDSVALLQQRGMASKKHKTVLRQTKGYRGRAKNCFSIAVRRLQKSLQHAYRDRKLKKRDMRKLWIQRIGAASKQHGIMYRDFIPALKNADVELNRKVLADIAATEPYSFRAVVDTVRSVK